ncbi:MAG: DUF480 domain-containing protein [Pirellulales bacterium]|nr:DUF480 domain-containing protein [Pirellulales bacterium]
MTPEVAAPRWQPLPAIERRVLGVLIEKAKTTPDNYPLSLTALCTGCNQKSNRDPQMHLQDVEVQEALDRLRQGGAVVFIEGSGRVEKYRHLAYEWLGVNKAELAVMCELLLRGPQTEGQLRGNVARMEPLADLAALRQVLAGLKARGLVLPLTPEGRGHVVAHALYPPEELVRLQTQYGAAAPSATRPHAPGNAPPASRRTPEQTASGTPIFSTSTEEIAREVSKAIAGVLATMDESALSAQLGEQLQATAQAQAAQHAPTAPGTSSTPGSHEVAALAQQVASLRAEVEALRTELQRCQAEIARLRDLLGIDPS